MFRTYLSYIFVALVIFCNNTQQQYIIPPISCPNYFQYLQDGSHYFGRIIVPSVSNNIEILVYFSQKQPLQTDYYGRIILESMQPITYRVEFPNPSEVPKLTKITLNGQDICISNEYAPPSTRLFLNHILQIPSQSLPISQPEIIFNQHMQRPQQQNTNIDPSFITLSGTSPNIFSNILQAQPLKPETQFTQSSPSSRPNKISAGTSKRPTVQAKPSKSQAQFTQNQSGSKSDKITAGSSNKQATQNAQCGEESNVAAFVFGGEEVRRGQFPWLTAIYVKSAGLRFLCAGSLVSTRTVISAAHCFKLSSISADRLVVNLGRHNLEDYSEQGFETREIQKLIVHPEYSSNVFPDADLAVLHLQKSVKLTANIRPICLWTGSSESNGILGKTGVVAGWGADETGRTFTPVPKKVTTKIVSDSECLRSSQAYSKLTSPRTFCAGNRDGSGPCMGDSGSGLMINRNGRWYLRGVVSAGQTKEQKCNLKEFVVFCDVAKHLQWVKKQMVS